MKALTISIALLATLLLPSCQDSISPASKAIRKFQKNYILNQYEKSAFQCISTGGGGDGERYNLLCIGFATNEQLNISSARTLIVENVLEYVREINQNNEFKEYFVEWPFKTNNLEYNFEVDRGDGLWPIFPNGLNNDNKISYVSFYENKLRYLIDVDPEKLPQEIHSETLGEAISILKADGWNEPDK